MTAAGLTDHEVERALGYTPCICGVIDGTWHPECYRGKTLEQISKEYKGALAKARRLLNLKYQQHSGDKP